MSLTRADLLELRRKAEEDYRRDLDAIDRMLERFCAPVQAGRIPETNPPGPAPRRATSFQSGLEEQVRRVMTNGARPSPWSAKGVYSMLKGHFNFAQKEEGAINSILYIQKALAENGLVHEERGSGRRPSQFTWKDEHYPYEGLKLLEEKEATEIAP